MAKSAREIIEKAFANNEPVFVIRAKDIHAMDALALYAQQVKLGGSPKSYGEDISRIVGEFAVWRLQHSDQVRYPD